MATKRAKIDPKDAKTIRGLQRCLEVIMALASGSLVDTKSARRRARRI